MKKWMNILSWVLLITAVLAALAFSRGAQKAHPCQSFSVNIDYGRQTVDYMITADEIRGHVFGACESPIGKSFDEIDLETYEQTVRSIPFVYTADVYLSIDGHMLANIHQRNPLVRVSTLGGSSYYLDEQGVKMPLSEYHSAHVMLAGGYVEDSLINGLDAPLAQADAVTKHSRLYKLFAVATYIHQDEFLKALISQIYVEENGDIQLIPRLGRHLIVLGDVNDLEERFEKLKHFYKQGIPKTGWDKYKIINIKFTDQVICTLK